MTGPATLPRLLLDRCAGQASAVAYATRRYGLWRELTWAAVGDEVFKAAEVLRRHSVGAGDYVVTIGDARLEFVTFTLAAQSLGACPVALYPGGPSSATEAVAAQLRPKALLAEATEDLDAFGSTVEGLGDRSWVIDDSARDRHRSADVRSWSACLPDVTETRHVDPAAGNPDSLAFVVVSEAADGAVSLHPLTYTDVISRWRSVLDRVPAITARDRLVVDAPLAHVAGLAGALVVPLLTGCRTFIVSDVDEVWISTRQVAPTLHIGPARRWVSLAGELDGALRATGLLRRAYVTAAARAHAAVAGGASGRRRSLAPASRLALRPLLAGIGAHRLRAALVTGTPLSAAVLSGWRTLGVPLTSVYGPPALAGAVATDDGSSDGLPVYLPLPDVVTRIAGDQTLEIRGREPSSAKKGGGRQEWIATGDVATDAGDGRFQVHGHLRGLDRRSEAAYTAEALEARLCESPLVRDAVVVDSDAGIIAFVVPSAGGEAPRARRRRRSTPTRSLVHAIEHDTVNRLNAELAARGGPVITAVRLLDDPDPRGWAPDGSVRAALRDRLAHLAREPEAVVSP